MAMDPEEAYWKIMEFSEEVLRSDVLRKIARRAAHRGRAVVVKETPVDAGHMRRAWRVQNTVNLAIRVRGSKLSVTGGKSASLVNDAPYAGIMVRGTRPFTPPFEPIFRWVARQQQVSLGGITIGPGYGQISGDRAGGDDIQKIRQLAMGLIKKIQTKGLPPRPFIRRALPKLREIFAEEAVKEMRDVGRRTGGSG